MLLLDYVVVSVILREKEKKGCVYW